MYKEEEREGTGTFLCVHGLKPRALPADSMASYSSSQRFTGRDASHGMLRRSLWSCFILRYNSGDSYPLNWMWPNVWTDYESLVWWSFLNIFDHYQSHICKHYVPHTSELTVEPLQSGEKMRFPENWRISSKNLSATHKKCFWGIISSPM